MKNRYNLFVSNIDSYLKLYSQVLGFIPYKISNKSDFYMYVGNSKVTFKETKKTTHYFIDIKIAESDYISIINWVSKVLITYREVFLFGLVFNLKRQTLFFDWHGNVLSFTPINKTKYSKNCIYVSSIQKIYHPFFINKNLLLKKKFNK